MNLTQTLVFWKLLIFKVAITSLVIVAAATAAALSGVNNWTELTHTQQVIIICGIVSVAGTNIISMMDKTFATLSANTQPTTPTVEQPKNQLTPPPDSGKSPETAVNQAPKP